MCRVIFATLSASNFFKLTKKRVPLFLSAALMWVCTIKANQRGMRGRRARHEQNIVLDYISHLKLPVSEIIRINALLMTAQLQCEKVRLIRNSLNSVCAAWRGTVKQLACKVFKSCDAMQCNAMQKKIQRKIDYKFLIDSRTKPQIFHFA